MRVAQSRGGGASALRRGLLCAVVFVFLWLVSWRPSDTASELKSMDQVLDQYIKFAIDTQNEYMHTANLVYPKAECKLTQIAEVHRAVVKPMDPGAMVYVVVEYETTAHSVMQVTFGVNQHDPTPSKSTILNIERLTPRSYKCPIPQEVFEAACECDNPLIA